MASFFSGVGCGGEAWFCVVACLDAAVCGADIASAEFGAGTLIREALLGETGSDY